MVTSDGSLEDLLDSHGWRGRTAAVLKEKDLESIRRQGLLDEADEGRRRSVGMYFFQVDVVLYGCAGQRVRECRGLELPLENLPLRSVGPY